MRIDYRELKKRIRLQDLLHEMGWHPSEGRGAQLRGPCPLPVCRVRTDNDPSPRRLRTFSVNTERNIFGCFSCGRSGTVIDFWAYYRAIDTDAAARERATRLTLDNNPPHPSSSPTPKS